MRRKPMNKSKDKKVFKKTVGLHPGNTIRSVMRGGIRK